MLTEAENTVVIIDDNQSIRESLSALLESTGLQVKSFASARAFLADQSLEAADCLIVDVRMPQMSGLELQEELARRHVSIPVIIVTGHADVPLAVRAMRAGAYDFLEKPFDDDHLLKSVSRAVAAGKRVRSNAAEARLAAKLIERLTERERQVLKELALGKSNKVIANALGISPRTVEIHRANVHRKMEAQSVADLVRAVRALGEDFPA